jgi:UDP-N-acetylglucosamine pyrophosphorylase
MTRYFKPASINTDIKNTEQQILNHQYVIDSRAHALAGKIQQQMAKPANLLLAVGIGFIAGELTRKGCSTTDDNSHATETSPLKTAFSLIGSARTLYAALPLVLMITSRYQTDASEQSTKANDAKV